MKLAPNSEVPIYLDALGAIAERGDRFLKRLADIETKLLEFDINDIAIEAPIFVTGAPRAATTLIAEILATGPETTSHQYRDDPFVHTPVFWHHLRRPVARRHGPVERAHRDGLKITLESPEAIDEMLWMSFFDGLHDPRRSNILTADTANPEFTRAYRANVRKLLMLRRAQRFCVKNNAHLARLRYIRTIFPDARFVVAIREPTAQVASLVKQDRLFRRIQANDARSRRYTRRLGHFEFGDHFAPANLDDHDHTQRILAHHRAGETARAYAHYWTATYAHIEAVLARDPELARATHVLSYDQLCRRPEAAITGMCRHCGLAPEPRTRRWTDHITAPQYPTPLDARTRAHVNAITATLAQRWLLNSPAP